MDIDDIIEELQYAESMGADVDWDSLSVNSSNNTYDEMDYYYGEMQEMAQLEREAKLREKAKKYKWYQMENNNEKREVIKTQYEIKIEELEKQYFKEIEEKIASKIKNFYDKEEFIEACCKKEYLYGYTENILEKVKFDLVIDKVLGIKNYWRETELEKEVENILEKYHSLSGEEYVEIIFRNEEKFWKYKNSIIDLYKEINNVYKQKDLDIRNSRYHIKELDFYLIEDEFDDDEFGLL